MLAPGSSYWRYWGKAHPATADHSCHLLPFHSLDVAAAGLTLLQEQPRFSAGLASFLGITLEALRSWLAFLLGLHDAGKFADGFQNLRPDLLSALQGRQVATACDERHDTLGYRFCAGRIDSPGVVVQLLAARTSWEGDPEDLWDLLTPWLNAASGHHGRPPVLRQAPRPLPHHFPAAVAADAKAFFQDLMALLLPQGAPFDLTDYRQLPVFRRISWLVAGLAVAADWIGSNTAWFPYRSTPMPLAAYWTRYALPQAAKAVAACGLLAASPARWSGLAALFPKIATLTPLQRLAETIDLSDYPQLFVVEEVTGGGKTEAALALAHRLLARGAADGVYLALPTMATANAMHQRVGDVYRRLFVEGASPSLVLAHSASRMALALEERNRADRGPGPGEETASRQCSAWLADSRKKALLAQVGVGTIDQALLAVLAARHQSMRLFGLCRKVLIADEVHASDAYVHRLLCTLLRFHAALGGSAILLSATLPAGMRQELIQAFAQPLGVDAAGPTMNVYPLVSRLTMDGLREYPVAARESARRRVGIQACHTEEEVTAFLSQVLDSGGCACWIRNTVDDALEAYQGWVARLGLQRVTVFHARFALGDRLATEAEVLRLFGPRSMAEDRRGRLLVATQVVEQSLDLDFDGMVSDLAPIDLLLQRAGRLKRHGRDPDGNRIAGFDQRGPAVLGVFSPQPSLEADAAWYRGAFPRAAWVYPHHGQLWLTARWLAAHQGFAMPEDARGMMEAVYGEDAQAQIPAGLLAASIKAEGDENAQSAQGRLNSLDLDQGYSATPLHWQDDDSAPTRLGEPTVTVRLARREAGRLIPWATSDDPRQAWQLSQLAIRKSRIAAEAPELAAGVLEAARATMPDLGKYCVAVVLEQNGTEWIGSALNSKGNLVRLGYDRTLGLQFPAGDAP
ncbi:MAG: CRISPR-associated helicase Cas3' [Thermodesulfobacteriota bacterium]